MKIKNLLYLIPVIFIMSCKNAKINYLQNIENVAVKTSMEESRLTIQPGDSLLVGITAKDMEVVKPFVQSGIGHKVDSEGNITISTLGKINVQGKKQEEIRSELTAQLKQYIKEPIVNVGLSNFKVTILGEVNKPKTYKMFEGATILNAIGAAGDLTIYGERKNILLVRNINGEISKHIIDITDADFINSPYYFLKQNDVIYVRANNAKANSSKYGNETSIYITIGSVLISVLLTVITLVKN